MPPKAPESKAAKAAKAMAGGKKKSKVRDDGRGRRWVARSRGEPYCDRGCARVGTLARAWGEAMRAEMRGCV